jgi:hypothetical protein
MDIAAIFLTLAVLFFAGAYLYAPFARGYGKHVTEEERELSALLAERERVLGSLQELDFDYKLGKIPEEDYPAQRTSLLQKGADILRRMDSLTIDETDLKRNGSGNTSRKKTIADAELENMISKRRMSRQVKFDGFCPKCGKPVMADDRFCPSCGKALK